MTFVGVDQITYKNGKEGRRTHAKSKQSLSFFRTHFQMESDHFEMKLHFQTSSFSLDISQLCR